MIFDTPIKKPDDGIYDVKRLCGKTFAFDYKRNEFIMYNGSPLVVDGEESVKQWVSAILRTQRERYAIYPDDFGADVKSYIGKKIPSGLNMSELRRELKESAAYMPAISDVGEIEYKDGKINCKIVLSSGREVEINDYYGHR